MNLFNYAVNYRNRNNNNHNLHQKNKYVEWHRYYSNSGKPFYYSPLTHYTQWEEPIHNAIIFDTNSPSFISNDCIIDPPSTTTTTTHIYKNKKISKNINTRKHQNKPPKFGFTLQHFEEIIMKNVEKTMNSGIEHSLPQYKLDSGEFVFGFQYKSDLDIMEEGYWLNTDI